MSKLGPWTDGDSAAGHRGLGGLVKVDDDDTSSWSCFPHNVYWLLSPRVLVCSSFDNTFLMTKNVPS